MEKFFDKAVIICLSNSQKLGDHFFNQYIGLPRRNSLLRILDLTLTKTSYARRSGIDISDKFQLKQNYFISFLKDIFAQKIISHFQRGKLQRILFATLLNLSYLSLFILLHRKTTPSRLKHTNNVKLVHL